MRRTKILGLSLITAAAMLALASSAWGGTTLTSPAGTELEAGTKLHASAEGLVALQGSLTVACSKSTIEGEVTNAGGLNATVKASVSSFTLEECGTNTVTVLKPGSLEIHGTGEGNGTLTSTGAEITILTHGTVGTIHCIYITNGTSIGTLTGSKSTGGTARLDIAGATIPQESTDAGCGSHSELAGSYKFTSPDYLDVDAPSGTTLTSSTGTIFGIGTHLQAKSETSITFDMSSPLNVPCKESIIEGALTKAGGSETTPVDSITSLTFFECNNSTVTVLNGGTLEFFTNTATADGNGTVTGNGAEITLLTHNIFGTLHCIYLTENTNLGTLTGSKNREGKTATWALNEAPLSLNATDFGCGTEPKLTGSYTFTTPDYLDVD